jgi:membrane associated rhomboid family serine protease
MLQFTPVTRNIIFICVAVFIIQMILRERAPDLALWPVNSAEFRPYQLFSYMFAHGGFSHIFFNMLMLAFAGAQLEVIWGQQKFLIFYVVTGIGAALIYLAVQYFMNPFGGNPMIGASGAIYGCLMGFGLLMPDRVITLIFPPVSIKAKYLVFILGGITYFFGGPNTAHAAHFGGAFVGFLLIKLFRF